MIAPGIVNGLWRAASWPAAAAFERAAEFPRETQERLLLKLLRRNASTWFGKRYGFATVRSIEDFQRLVPVSSYRDYEAGIARLRQGEAGVFTVEPVVRLVPTSGSTSARKRIPYTRALLSEFNRAVSVWISDLFRLVPAAFEGKSYWAISPPVEETPLTCPPTRGEGSVPPSPRVPEGFGTDSEYLGKMGRWLERSVLAVGPDVRLCRGIEEFRWETLRALVACEDLSLISVWHPSFLLLLMEALPERLSKLAAVLPAHRRRLERASRVRPEEIPGLLWPRLALVSTWLDGGAGMERPKLRALFPGAVIQGKGLLSTEGIVSIPFGLSGCGIPALTSHFLEFVSESGDVRLVDEIRVGKTYEVLLTTGGGLYRYRLGDRVTVRGRSGKLPLLTFSGRTGVVSDHAGEKLDEELVRNLVCARLAQLGLEPGFWFLSFATSGRGYVLFLEISEELDLRDLGRSIDDSLSAAFHYSLARRLGQLEMVRVYRLSPGARSRFYEEMGRRGQRAGDVKPGCLVPVGDWQGVMPGAMVDIL